MCRAGRRIARHVSRLSLSPHVGPATAHVLLPPPTALTTRGRLRRSMTCGTGRRGGPTRRWVGGCVAGSAWRWFWWCVIGDGWGEEAAAASMKCVEIHVSGGGGEKAGGGWSPLSRQVGARTSGGWIAWSHRGGDAWIVCGAVERGLYGLSDVLFSSRKENF